jgi:hypothetical protein
MLAIQLAHIDFLDEQIEALSAEITRCLTDLSAEAVPLPSPASSAAADGAAEAAAWGAPLTFTRAITLLDTMPGVDRRQTSSRFPLRPCGMTPTVSGGLSHDPVGTNSKSPICRTGEG